MAVFSAKFSLEIIFDEPVIRWVLYAHAAICTKFCRRISPKQTSLATETVFFTKPMYVLGQFFSPLTKLLEKKVSRKLQSRSEASSRGYLWNKSWMLPCFRGPATIPCLIFFTQWKIYKNSIERKKSLNVSTSGILEGCFSLFPSQNSVFFSLLTRPSILNSWRLRRAKCQQKSSLKKLYQKSEVSC